MPSPMEELLQRLINDPALLQKIKKMEQESVKLTLQEKKKKRELDRFGTLDYLNSVEVHCKLCGTITTRYSPMIWDKIDKLHRASCFSEIIREEWLSLSVKKIKQIRPTCNYCEANLKEWDIDLLIKKAIFLAEHQS